MARGAGAVVAIDAPEGDCRRAGGRPQRRSQRSSVDVVSGPSARCVTERSTRGRSIRSATGAAGAPGRRRRHWDRARIVPRGRTSDRRTRVAGRRRGRSTRRGGVVASGAFAASAGRRSGRDLPTRCATGRAGARGLPYRRSRSCRGRGGPRPAQPAYATTTGGRRAPAGTRRWVPGTTSSRIVRCLDRWRGHHRAATRCGGHRVSPGWAGRVGGAAIGGRRVPAARRGQVGGGSDRGTRSRSHPSRVPKRGRRGIGTWGRGR